MKCPFCAEEGEQSRITPEGGYSTLIGWSPYYDEDGVYHSHDPNQRRRSYLCSRGHRFSKSGRPACPGCEDQEEPEIRLVEVRCPSSGTPLDESLGKHACPECGQDVASSSLSRPVDGEYVISYSRQLHYVRVKS